MNQFEPIKTILIAISSFKDVYTSEEAEQIVRGMLEREYIVSMVPMCDGGEYTLDVLKKHFGPNAEIKEAEGICNPYGKTICVPYLVTGDTAYIVSSEVLHLSLEEDAYKNPLTLTDYGLGQVILDAVNNGYRNIHLCLGGTSTVGLGIGTAQALGAKLLDCFGKELPERITPVDYHRIHRIIWNPERFAGIDLTVINDGVTEGKDLCNVNPLKIGASFSGIKDEILDRLDKALNHICQITDLNRNDPFSGNGGGIYYGIQSLFNANYVRGTDYFICLFQLEEQMRKADLVITGEGRFDNPELGKIPVAVSELAASCGKPVCYLCGKIAPEWNPSQEKIIINPELKNIYGIDVLAECSGDNEDLLYQCRNEKDYYRETTPFFIKKRLMEMGILHE